MEVAMRFFILFLSVVICGCSQSDSEKAPNRTSGVDSSQKASKNATAAEVAKELRGQVSCPAKLKSNTESHVGPTADIKGLRPGMAYDDAVNIVLCTDEMLVIETDETRGFDIGDTDHSIRQGFEARFAEPRVEKSSKQIMQEMEQNSLNRSLNRRVQDVQPGQSKWYVGTMGMPGDEQVINAAREEWFEDDRSPSIASVIKALNDKYGTPTKSYTLGGLQYLVWAYDPQGNFLTENSFQCKSFSPDPDSAINFSTECGIIVMAGIGPKRENSELTQYMQVAFVDQAGGYERVVSTERILKELIAKRRADEVEKAERDTKAPSL